MPNRFLHLLLLLATYPLLSSCEKILPEKATVLSSSKDFWIDRCEIKYRDKEFPITGSLSDVVKLLGPYDRFTQRGFRYFWDDMGLQVETATDSDRILDIGLLFNHEETSTEMGLRLADRPEDRLALAATKETRPQGFFRGELVIEGAHIGPEIDFDKINKTRQAYLKTQTGPDTQPKPIQESWSATRYAFERHCADGKHLRFIFRMMPFESVPPTRLEAITIGSDNVPDSTVTHDVKRIE
ncbi:MAG: hypothetical protein V4660_13070 [Pseudomonadota bacterium]